MTKTEAIKLMGLTKCDIDYIWLSNFDTKENGAWRAIYKDDSGNRWAWIYGEFYRVEKVSQGCVPRESATTLLKIKESKIVLSSKKMAEFHDEFDGIIINAVHRLAESVADKQLDPDKLWDAAFNIGWLPPIEELAEPLIEEAYGFTYESDGLGF